MSDEVTIDVGPVFCPSCKREFGNTERDRLASLLETAQHGLWQLKEITAMMADPSANWTDDVLRQHVEHLAPMVAAIHAAAAPPVPGEPQGEET